MYTFKRIDDAEVLVTNIEATNKPSLMGLRKTGADIMITITHDHSTDIKATISHHEPNALDNTQEHEYYNGKAYIFMSKQQAQELIDQLTKLL